MESVPVLRPAHTIHVRSTSTLSRRDWNAFVAPCLCGLGVSHDCRFDDLPGTCHAVSLRAPLYREPAMVVRRSLGVPAVLFLADPQLCEDHRLQLDGRFLRLSAQPKATLAFGGSGWRRSPNPGALPLGRRLFLFLPRDSRRLRLWLDFDSVL